jgi:hypothetical protein
MCFNFWIGVFHPVSSMYECGVNVVVLVFGIVVVVYQLHGISVRSSACSSPGVLMAILFLPIGCFGGLIRCSLFSSVAGQFLSMSETLSIFNWNVRVLNAPVRREAVWSMIQSVNLKLVCLQETKLAHITPQLAIEVLGNRFNYFSSLPSSGTRGGIMLGFHTS